MMFDTTTIDLQNIYDSIDLFKDYNKAFSDALSLKSPSTSIYNKNFANILPPISNKEEENSPDFKLSIPKNFIKLKF